MSAVVYVRQDANVVTGEPTHGALATGEGACRKIAHVRQDALRIENG